MGSVRSSPRTTRTIQAVSGRVTAVAPQIYVVLEGDRPLAGSSRHSLAGIDEVIVGRGAARRWERALQVRKHLLALQIPDPWMSEPTHARLHLEHATWIQDAGSRNGTLVNGSPVERAELRDGDVVEMGHTFFVYRESRAVAPDDALDLASESIAAPEGLITLDTKLAHELYALCHVARTTTSIVIQGESGTGKELAARAVHELSGRSGRFIAINAGALPQTLAESELFGYKRGAFSGATHDRDGLIAASDGGTLFLDEIGDLPMPSQVSLLRVLEDQEVRPLGSTTSTRVDLRVVAATHRNLREMVSRGEFREDLYARIAGFTLELPPLRDRREDLGVVLDALLRRLPAERASQVTFEGRALRTLFAYSWPRNVRELEKCLQTALALAGDEAVKHRHLPKDIRAALDSSDDCGLADATPPPGPAPLSAEDSERRDALIALLREHGGNVTRVAELMGKKRQQIQKWCKRYGIAAGTYR
jgi:transcriptional regulator with GAF, ATPase, and Fis domain